MDRDSLQQFRQRIDDSYLVINRAINGTAEQIADYIRLLGKRATARWVYQWGERQTLRRSNFLESYLRNLTAFYLAGNESGADLIRHCAEIYFRDLRRVLNLNGQTAIDDYTAGELLIIREKVDSLLAA